MGCTDLLPLLDFSAALFSSLLLALSLLQQSLRNEDLVLCWNSSVVGGASVIVREVKIAESELQLWRGILRLVLGITRRNEFDR